MDEVEASLIKGKIDVSRIVNRHYTWLDCKHYRFEMKKLLTRCIKVQATQERPVIPRALSLPRLILVSLIAVVSRVLLLNWQSG